jgi:hypothetical protein
MQSTIRSGFRRQIKDLIAETDRKIDEGMWGGWVSPLVSSSSCKIAHSHCNSNGHRIELLGAEKLCTKCGMSLEEIRGGKSKTPETEG